MSGWRKRVLTPFTIVSSLVVASLAAYPGLRLAESPLQWLVLVSCALLVWLLPVYHWASEADRFARWEIASQQASFVAMGYLSTLFALTLGRDLLLLGLALLEREELFLRVRDSTSGWRALGAGAAYCAYGAWRAFRGPRLREVTAPVANLPEGLQGLRIALITDLHVGPTIGRSYVEKTVRKVSAARPDLVAITGDLVDGNVADLAGSLEPLRQLAPRGRVFYVPGNHEYYWSIEQWLPAIAALGAEPLLNRGVALEHAGSRLWVAGIPDPAARSFGAEAPDVQKAAGAAEAGMFKLLLAHQPQAASAAAKAGFDLQLSGHTHGGQFFPWTWVGRFFHRHYIGLRREGPLWIYVSPGTGTWGPPMRVGTTPEVTVLRLAGAQAHRRP